MCAQHRAQEHFHIPGQLEATCTRTQEDELLSLGLATTGDPRRPFFRRWRWGYPLDDQVLSLWKSLR